jgi:putative transposase
MRPTREHATHNDQTYMVTTETWGRRDLFGNERWAKLLIDTLCHYRGTAYLLHEFVIMPDHIHVLMTPKTSLEKAVQFIKGGFSYRVKKELGSNMEVWQKGFSDHRIRDASDYQVHVSYVRQNPVRKHLSGRAEDYPYSSASARFDLDEAPQGLKPIGLDATDGAPEGAPLQSASDSMSECAPLQIAANGAAEAAPLQCTSQGPTEGTALQDRPNLPAQGSSLQTMAAGATEGVPLRSKAPEKVDATLLQKKPRKTAS